MDRRPSSPCLRTSLLKLASSLLLANCPELKEGYERKLVRDIFTHELFFVMDVCQFIRHLKHWSLFTNNLLPNLVSYFETKLSNSLLSSEEVDEILFILTEIAAEKVSLEKGFDDCETDDMTTFSFLKLAGKLGKAWWEILFKLDFEALSDLSGMQNIWASLVCLPYVRYIQYDYNTKTFINRTPYFFSYFSHPVHMKRGVICGNFLSWLNNVYLSLQTAWLWISFQISCETLFSSPQGTTVFKWKDPSLISSFTSCEMCFTVV